MNDSAPTTDFTALALTRHSCRKFLPNPVPRNIIEKIFEAVRMAPSACNRQPWIFLIADTAELRQIVIGSYNRSWMETAPMFVIACGNHDEGWKRASDGKDHTDIDVAIAVEHLCLSASAEGIGTCWVCNFDVSALKEQLNLPAHIEPIAIIPMGYFDYEYDSSDKQRKTINEIIKWGKY